MADLLHISKDVAAVNAVVNHPSVKPGLDFGLPGDLDLASLVENPRNICFMGEHGGGIAIWSAPGVYDLHDFILPEGRGKWALDASQEFYAYMFGKLHARMLWTQTPVENRASRIFNRILGFKSEGVEETTIVPGKPQFVETFVMERRCL